jgi:hypothetical protein
VIKAHGIRVDDLRMSQPYEFFPGAAAPEPAGVFGQPVSSYGVAATTNSSPRDTPARPPIVSVLAGLLVAQATLAAGPAVTLLLLRDVIGAAMNALTAGFGGGDLGSLESGSAPSGTGSVTLWGFLLLLLTVLSALSAVAVLDRCAWAVVAAGIAELGLLVWSLAHFGSVPTVATVGVLLALAIGGLLAMPDVRRWCLAT